MSKKLSEMTLDELWQLFPIYLTKHQSCWSDWYEEELNLLRSVLPLGSVSRISHIGSTAVDSIWAKPIIDILVEARDHQEEIRHCLAAAGYTCMSESETRVSFNKGYSENGFAQRVFHLHLRREGDHDELYFRDYLLTYPEIAAEYEQLKLALWKQYEHDRDGYTNAKHEFIARHTQDARQAFQGRYERGALPDGFKLPT